jgi:hypothetical protein
MRRRWWPIGLAALAVANPAFAEETAALGLAFSFLAMLLALPTLALLAVALFSLRGEATGWTSLVGMACSLVGGLLAIVCFMFVLVEPPGALVAGGALPGLMFVTHLYRWIIRALRGPRVPR